MNNLEKLYAKIPQNADCLLITSDINRHYFTGFKSSAGALLVFKDTAYLIVDFRYYEKASNTVDVCNVVKMDGYYKQINEYLLKHNAKNIYIESDTMTVSELNTLSEKLDDNMLVVSTSELSDAINKIRSLKADIEVQKIIKAQQIAEDALTYALENFHDGMTEKQLAYTLNDYMLRNGADDISFDTIALSGKNTSLPHGVPTNKIIEKGDFILMDFGAVYEGYHSDMTRTVCYGNPSDKMREVYDIVLNAQELALSAFKCGVSCKDIDTISRNYIKDNGYGEFFGHGLGHSVGMEIHENPACNTRDETLLESGIIMTCEPGIYLPNEFGVRIEDMVVITENGYENLTKATKNLVVL